jgi:hypothetical protein
MDAEAQIAFVDIRMDGVGFSMAQPGSSFVMSGLTGPVSLCYGALSLDETSWRVSRHDKTSIWGHKSVAGH